MNDFLKEMLPYLFGILSTPLGAWLGSLLEKRKYNIILDELNAKIDAQRSSNKATELDNVHKGNQILMEDIVEPLKERINELEQQLERFQYAVSKIYACTYAPSCPVVKCLSYYSQGKDRYRGTEQADKRPQGGRAPTATA